MVSEGEGIKGNKSPIVVNVGSALATFAKMRIHFKYRKTWWWYLVHYNYFHKKLFKKFYPRKTKNFSEKEINKYHLYQKIDDLITLRKWDWLRVHLWKLDYGYKQTFKIKWREK